ncbi:hypothetical protein N665_3798s0002 [Sinapis alba]|nr:hypothetical protein N665_3798s0002 [Sinapis alba]
MKMKKTTKVFLLLSLLYIFLCLSFQVRGTEAARFRHLGKLPICTKPPPPCGDSPKGSDPVKGQKHTRCRPIPRPPPPSDC